MGRLLVTVSNFRIEESEGKTRVYAAEREFLRQMEKDIDALASEIGSLANLCAIRQGILGMECLCLSTDVFETTDISLINDDKLSIQIDAVCAFAYLIHKHNIPADVTGHVLNLAPHEKIIFALYVLSEIFNGESDT